METYLFKNNIGKSIFINDFIKNIPLIYTEYINKKFILSDLYITLDNKNPSFNIYHLETKCCECFLCKKNININFKEKKTYFNNIYNKLLNNNIINIINNKLDKYNNNKIFIYKNKINTNTYIYYYFHLCDKCFNLNLYYWYITHNNTYPSSKIDGYNFIYNNYKYIEKINTKFLVNKIKNIKFPNIFIC